jgi:hypothetical protein
MVRRDDLNRNHILWIAQIVVNRKGTVLAAADDNGEVKVINLEKHNLQKTLSRGGHANVRAKSITAPTICSVTLVMWAKMPRSLSTNRALTCVKLFRLTGISMFIIIII